MEYNYVGWINLRLERRDNERREQEMSEARLGRRFKLRAHRSNEQRPSLRKLGGFFTFNP